VADALRPRWGQPATGIVAFFAFLLVAWCLWFIFSDPRGPVGAFPYPFVLYLAMMILMGLWQHMLLGDWPFEQMRQPVRGVVQTAVNLVLVWFVIHVVFYKVLGLGFNFLSQENLNALAAGGQAILADGQAASLQVMEARDFGQRAIVAFVLIGFFTYPFVTILFAKWPIRPSNLTQPQAGLAEIGWCTSLTVLFYTVLIVPFWATVYAPSIALNTPWWGGLAGTRHLHWVFGFWEWMIIVLFMTANVWRGKPWSAIALPQPLKGVVSFLVIVAAGYALAVLCVNLAPAWLPQATIQELEQRNDLTRFLWYHAAEIAGFTLIPFLAWHHYFDDMVPMADKDSWAAFAFRTAGVVALAALNYVVFYYLGFVHWGIGNEHAAHLEHAFPEGESLVWNFWWIIPLLWNEWFFHKWPFYVHEHSTSHAAAAPIAAGR
jgi:AAT family amino acid transporter